MEISNNSDVRLKETNDLLVRVFFDHPNLPDPGLRFLLKNVVKPMSNQDVSTLYNFVCLFVCPCEESFPKTPVSYS